MSESALQDELAALRSDAEANAADETLASRLSRLEHAIAALQDTKLMEERLVERLASRMPPPAAGGSQANALADAGKALLPMAMRTIAAGADAAGQAPSRSYLLLDVLADVRTFLKMPFDYRFQMSWAAKLLPLAAIGTMLMSWFFVRGMPLIGGLLDYAVIILLAMLVYKTWSREAARYREQTANLPPRR